MNIVCHAETMRYKFLQSFGSVANTYLQPTSNTITQFVGPLMVAICQGFFVHRTFSVRPLKATPSLHQLIRYRRRRPKTTLCWGGCASSCSGP